ncbi:type VII secretion protein EccCb [Dietzia cinnamea]|nr:type VII secretion protein EccCb [Dietzia cinnamea]MBM7229307.1 type VII secretion protein EccCb [Dietzia cinnamea]
MKDALYGEMTRRQELLRAAGNFANVGDYERARAAGAALDPLPALFIVVDEFSELLTQKPDFAELFVAIGRLGRSLQMHLLLASQRLEEGKLRGLDSHLSYRIGLKTFSSSESRSVLGVVDAYHLPGTPGAGYLKTDSDDLTRFHAAYVSGPYEQPVIDDDDDERTGPRQRVVEFTSTGVPLPELPDSERDASDADHDAAAPAGPAGGVGAVDAAGPFGGAGAFAGLPSMADLLADSPPGSSPDTDPGTDADAAPAGVEHTPRSLLDVVVDRLRGHGRPAHEVWLPPLDEPESVDVLLGGPVREPVPAAAPPSLAWPIGTVDKPFEQRRDPMVVELAGGAGNIAVAGGPQSGKSTALRMLIMSAAATHAPEHVQFFCVDLGGGSLAGLRDVPHVGYVAGRRDLDGIRRSVAELTTLLAEREARFRRHGVESMTDFRRLRAEYLALEPDERASHPLHGDRFGDVFLVIDGWATFRGEFEELAEKVTALTSGGLSYGIHVVVSVSRWAELRSTMKDFMGTRVELRLGDPGESEAGRVKGALVPEGRPGRGILKSGLHTLIGLPRLDGGSSVDDLAEGVRAAAADLQVLYGDRSAPPVRLLADDIPRAAVLAEIEAAGVRIRPNRALLGIGENALQPVTLDFRTQPHFMAFADAGSGKTTVLRNIVESIVATTTPEEAKILLVDYRRSLLGVVPQDHLAGYISSAKSAHTLIPQLVPYFQNRLPGDDVTAEQLATRSWWTGPEVYVVVDDHDLVAPSPGSDPLSELHQFFPQARDVGLHIVLTRRMGGVSRAMFSGTIAKLRELSVDVLVMSGSRDEGNIVGKLKPSPLPPGRGTLVSRDTGTQMIQVCSVPPVVSSAPDQD